MKRVLSLVTILSLAAGMTLFGAEEKKKGGPMPSLAERTIKKFEAVGLTDEQKGKITEAAGPVEAKIKEANAKAPLTDAQKTARKEAEAKVKAEGKTGKEAKDAIAAAVALTPEQIAAQQEVGKLNKEFNGAVMALLTADQKAKLPQPAGKKPK